MATEIRVPSLGESVTEATIGTWFKKQGEQVLAEEPLVELETDKVTLEVPAPASGVLVELTANEGDTVAVGALLGSIADEAGASPVAAEKQAKPASPPAASEAKAGAASPASQPLSPAVRKMVEENNLDPSSITGTGKDGRLTKADVKA